MGVTRVSRAYVIEGVTGMSWLYQGGVKGVSNECHWVVKGMS